MKKLVLLVTALLAVLVLTSCSEDVDYTYHTEATVNVLATDWLIKDEIFAFNATDNEAGEAANTYDSTESHVRVFLPTDISASLRVNYISLGDNTDTVTQSVNMAYAFTDTGLEKSVYAAACAEVVNNTETTNLVTDAFALASTSSDYKNSITMLDDDQSRDDLYAVIVFMPVITKYYIQSGDTAVRSNFSYTLVPIYSVLANKNGDVYEGVDSSVTDLAEITLTTSDYVVNSFS